MPECVNAAFFVVAHKPNRVTIHLLNGAVGHGFFSGGVFKQIGTGFVLCQILVDDGFEFVGEYHVAVFFAFTTPDMEFSAVIEVG